MFSSFFPERFLALFRPPCVPCAGLRFVFGWELMLVGWRLCQLLDTTPIAMVLRYYMPVFRDAYQNGGFWGTPSGWVLPAVARTQPALARQMVRDAVTDARRNGLNEWKNSAFSTGYAAGELTVPTGGWVPRCGQPISLSFVHPRWQLFLAVGQDSSWMYQLPISCCLLPLTSPPPPLPPDCTAPHRPPALTRRYEAFPTTGD